MADGNTRGFDAAVAATLDKLGLDVLSQPDKFVGAISDLYDPESPEMTVLYAHRSDDLLRPFAEAADTGTPDALVMAAKRAELYLHDVRRVLGDDAHGVAWGIARGVAAHLSVPAPRDTRGAGEGAGETVSWGPAVLANQGIEDQEVTEALGESRPPAGTQGADRLAMGLNQKLDELPDEREETKAIHKAEEERETTDEAARKETKSTTGNRRRGTVLAVIACIGMGAALALIACIVTFIAQVAQFQHNGRGGDSGTAISSATHTVDQGQELGSKKYTIATDTRFLPFEYTEEDGTLVGIDIDLLAAVAKDQGFDYELVPADFDTASQEVLDGTADGIIAGLGITDERKRDFDFSVPYYDCTVCCAVKVGSDIESLDDLKGASVAVKDGTMSQDWAKSIAGKYGFKMTAFTSSDTMYKDVETGNSAACFEDTPVMGYHIHQHESTGGKKGSNFSIIAEGDSEFTTPYAFAVCKGKNPELLKAFNDGLSNIKRDGTYDEVINKYVRSAT